MASKFARDRSNEEDRFEFPVSENFKCSICFNVLNNPKGCRKNQHYFCFACIREHLKHSHTCPECMDELTPETLVDPPRVLLNCIQELRIKCGYSDRGCPEYVQLCRLQNHVDECGFAPVVCENEGCGAEVNKGEKVHHETELCKFRKVECHGCRELKKEIRELRKSQRKAAKSMEEKQKEVDGRIAALIGNQLQIKKGVKEIRIAVGSSLQKMDSFFDDILSPTTQSDEALKPYCIHPTQQLRPPFNRDIFIMGGMDGNDKITNYVEMFCCKEGRWVDVASMIVPREAASSVVVDNQIIVSGGLVRRVGDNNKQRTDSIEILDLEKHSYKWKMLDAKLPFPEAFHRTFLYKGKLIVVGNKTIFQIQLSAPHAVKELYALPSFSIGFGAELVNEKIYIFRSQGAVLVYDLVANECRIMPSLPFILQNMSTVVLGDKVVLVGGMRKVVGTHGNERNERTADVIMYDTETGESEILPAMKHKRNDCSAVLVDGMIVVMGGHYNSVEYYDFRTNTWKALKAMKMLTSRTTAVVSPLPNQSD